MSDKTSSIVLFEQKEVRRVWDEKADQWFFSIIDIIEVLTGSTIPKRYWTDLKKSCLTRVFSCTIKSYN